MVKAWQYYYFLIRELNVDVKMMNANFARIFPWRPTWWPWVQCSL